MNAKLPPSPKRNYHLIGEAMARPFGEKIGRGRVRDGGVTDGEPLPGVKRSTGAQKRR